MSNSGKSSLSESQIATQVAAAIGNMATDAGKRADEMVASAGSQIQGFSHRMSAAGPQSGILHDASQAVASTIRSGGEYLHDQKLSGMSEDVAQVIRKNPISAVLIALGVGWIIARRV